MPVLEYLGKTPRTFILPIPWLARSDRRGEVTFNPTADVDEATADFLINECGDAFRPVKTETVQEALGEIWTPAKQTTQTAIDKAVGKRFSGKAGKWNAKAYLNRHHLQSLVGMKALKLGRTVVHWELVLLTEGAFPAPSDGSASPIPPQGEGQKGAHGHGDAG